MDNTERGRATLPIDIVEDNFQAIASAIKQLM